MRLLFLLDLIGALLCGCNRPRSQTANNAPPNTSAPPAQQPAASPGATPADKERAPKPPAPQPRATPTDGSGRDTPRAVSPDASAEIVKAKKALDALASYVGDEWESVASPVLSSACTAHPVSLYVAALCHLWGVGTPEDIAAAHSLLLKAQAGGSVEASQQIDTIKELRQEARTAGRTNVESIQYAALMAERLFARP